MLSVLCVCVCYVNGGNSLRNLKLFFIVHGIWDQRSREEKEMTRALPRDSEKAVSDMRTTFGGLWVKMKE